VRPGLDQLEQRTQQFTIDVLKLCTALEQVPGMRQLTWQLADCAGSVGANHRAMRRARSRREFAAKLQIVNEGIDESVFWLEVAQAVDPTVARPKVAAALAEGLQLRSIFAKARATTRRAEKDSGAQGLHE
jgi:four helix bundle protein